MPLMGISENDINEQPADDDLPGKVAGDADGTDGTDGDGTDGDGTDTTDSDGTDGTDGTDNARMGLLIGSDHLRVVEIPADPCGTAACAQSAPNLLASRSPRHSGTGWGGRQRLGPTGAAA